MPTSQAPQTLPALFASAAERFRGQELGRYYRDGVLHGLGWDDAADRVRRLASGLMRLGVRPGESVAIVSRSSHRWALCDLAILSVGAVTVGVYPDARAEDLSFVLADSGARVAVVENSATARNLVARPEAAEHLEQVLIMHPDPQDAGPPGLKVGSLDHAIDRGRADTPDARRAWEARRHAVRPDDIATIVYTSGTTGRPKGAQLTHTNLMHTARAMAALFPMSVADLSIVYLPLAHVLQRVSVYTSMFHGGRGVYLETPEQLPQALAAVKPTVLVGVPRVYEKAHARFQARLREGPAHQQRLFRWGLEIGQRYSRLVRDGQPIPAGLRAKHAVADRLVLRRVRDFFGGRVRFMLSGAAPLSMETLTFFHACGLLILEGYGLAETAAPVTMNTPGSWRFGTVGRPIVGCEVRLAGDDEILVRGPNVFRGYRNRPDATDEAFLEAADGGRPWLRTGDLGTLDEDGFLRIVDRKENVLVTAAGRRIPPRPIEEALRAHPLVEHACVIGDQQRYLVTLLTLDPETAAGWAERKGLARRDIAWLANHPLVLDTLDAHVASVNAHRPPWETIKRFAVLPSSFTVEEGLLTPTLKLRRRAIEQRHAELLELLY
ncbi:MAG: AMP-dependent synthetase/ligase [Myxococcota bacterium]